jgi:hypothetical protein
VKIVVQVKLLPDASQAPELEATLRAVNDAANMVSAVAFDRRVFREYDLASTSTATSRPGVSALRPPST